MKKNKVGTTQKTYTCSFPITFGAVAPTQVGTHNQPLTTVILLVPPHLCAWLAFIPKSFWILCAYVLSCSVMSDSLPPPCTVALQTPLSMEFSRQEYWSRLPFPTPGNLPNPGIKPLSLASPALAGRFFTTSATWEAQDALYHILNSVFESIYKLCLLYKWAEYTDYSCVCHKSKAKPTNPQSYILF